MHHWRDCKEWNDVGLPLSTTSNEAAKMYDAIVGQSVGVYHNDSVGGLRKCVERMRIADPSFVMGHAITNMVHLLGTGQNAHTSEDMRTSVENMVKLANKTDITNRERLHVDAVNMFAYGDLTGACEKWERILVDHPTDIVATYNAHDVYFYKGEAQPMRDSTARVLPHWNTQMPYYGHLLGMHAFGLVETNLFKEAEDTAREGLDVNPRDNWSTHSLNHVLEYTGRHKEGIEFLNSTVEMWEKGSLFASHNYWHWALFHIERREYEDAFGIYDSEIAPRALKHKGMVEILDATSFLKRMELEGQSVGDRWQDIAEISESHIHDHIVALNDIHILMASLGAKQTDMTKTLMDTLRKQTSKLPDQRSSVFREVGLPLCESFVAADQGDYARAVDILHPIRYKVVNIGGSHAQRDIFNLFLIDAALKSTEKTHHKLARCLLAERQAKRKDSPLTDRLVTRSLAVHID